MFFLVLLAVIGAGTTGIALENLDDEEMMLQDGTYAVDPEALREAAQSYHEAAEKPVVLVIRRIEGGSPSYSRPTEEELRVLGLKKAKLLEDGTVCHTSSACEAPSPFDPNTAASVSQRITTFCMQLNLTPPWETTETTGVPSASTPAEAPGSSHAPSAPRESSLAARILAEERAENSEQQAAAAAPEATAAAAGKEVAVAPLSSAHLPEEGASGRARAEAAAAALVGAGIMSPSQAVAATDAAMAAAPSQEAAAAEEKAAAEERLAAAEVKSAAGAESPVGTRSEGSRSSNSNSSSSEGGSASYDCATLACLNVGRSLNPNLRAKREDDDNASLLPEPPEQRQDQVVVQNSEADQQKALELNFRRKLAAQEDDVPGQCLLCFDREPDAVFLGCGHGGVCYQCAMDTFVAHREVCPFCRGKVQQIVTIARKTALHSSGLHTVKVTGPKRHPVMGALGLRF